MVRKCDSVHSDTILQTLLHSRWMTFVSLGGESWQTLRQVYYVILYVFMNSVATPDNSFNIKLCNSLPLHGREVSEGEKRLG